MAARPRILYVTAHPDDGALSGARMRVHHIGEALRRAGEVTLFLVTDEPPDRATMERARARFGEVIVFPLEASPVRSLGDRIAHEVDAGFLNTHGMVVGAAGRQALREAATRHDLVWVHRLGIANAFRIQKWPHSVLDVDDLHSQLYDSMAACRRPSLRQLLDRRMARLWRARERRLPSRFDRLVVCSESDRRALGHPSITHVVNNGFARPEAEPVFLAREGLRLGFIGLMSYGPNAAGVRWFLQEVWPLVKQRVPLARLRLVGAGGEALVQDRACADVDVLGYVDDPDEEIRTWSASIVPVRYGGGTRIKIAEAFARKCPLVSTPLGAFGYDVKDGQELLLAETAPAFAAACTRLLEQPQSAAPMVERAWLRFVDEWTWAAAERAAEAALDAALARKSQRETVGNAPPMSIATP